MNSIITGTGSYIPDLIIPNSFFADTDFFEPDGSRLQKTNDVIIQKFAEITGITERRYAQQHDVASDLGFYAAREAINSASLDKETLDYIIVAHNFGDVVNNSNRVTMVPNLASRVKALLKINNPDCVAYDLPFGCPGWVEGLIHANAFIKSGYAKRCLVIGSETLSRVIDNSDRDSMIFSDGAGAAIVEAFDSSDGILSHKTQTHAEHSMLLNMESSNNPAVRSSSDRFLKMKGRKVYEFALNQVPLVIKSALEKANVNLIDVKKIIVHQANEKMDHAIGERLFKLYNLPPTLKNVMPMTVNFLGNSSVATVPTLLDLILKGKLGEHSITKGDLVVFASVGAGMNINAVVYQF
jgi:3-oxoacyl-[acyl-carrier-protein] synthase III